MNSSFVGPSHLRVKRHVGVGFSMLSCRSTNCLWETQLVRFLQRLGRVVVSWRRRVKNGSKLLAPHPHCISHLPRRCRPWCRRSRFVCALSSTCGIIIVGRYRHRRLYCRHRAASSLSWPMVACSRGIVLYAGVGKWGDLWDGMRGAMAKTNHDKCHGSCFVAHLLPRIVLWGCPYRVVAPTYKGGGLSSSWVVRYTGVG